MEDVMSGLSGRALLNERKGVEIDYCPKCRGVWLDRGELDKLIERSAMVSYNREHGYDDDDYKHYREHQEHPDYHKRKRKAGSMTSSISIKIEDGSATEAQSAQRITNPLCVSFGPVCTPMLHFQSSRFTRMFLKRTMLFGSCACQSECAVVENSREGLASFPIGRLFPIHRDLVVDLDGDVFAFDDDVVGVPLVVLDQLLLEVHHVI